ncbi:MAG: 5-formyltetrahydrofolate cyclo-ligase [Clostridia bacterium]|nr:5-formyltetrahydrofolate cyclo-ligase [Clostridia bacterium]
MKEIRTAKNALRQEYRAKRRLIPREKKEALDKKICDTVISLASFRFADAILLFAPLDDEIDVFPIAKEALRRKKTVAFPISPPGGIMNFHTVDSLDSLIPGNMGILEPPKDTSLFDGTGKNCLCIVPAFIFDKKGYRVGYGGGYYDRFLPSFSGSTMGVIYSDCILERVPRGRFDLSVDILVSEKGVTVTSEK